MGLSPCPPVLVGLQAPRRDPLPSAQPRPPGPHSDKHAQCLGGSQLEIRALWFHFLPHRSRSTGMDSLLAFDSGTLSQIRNAKFRRCPKGTVYEICCKKQNCWFLWVAYRSCNWYLIPYILWTKFFLSDVYVLWVFSPSLWLTFSFS